MSFWVCLAVVKIIHEFGHGLTAKHFGGEVHEMGILFLVLTPALYCDVTDSWLLPNKWKRIWISAAGIYVECFLASIATFVWWYSTPGLLNSLAMATMFICSVNTIMFNANPLLRYDGYYVMADWLEIPNLRIKSTQFFAYLVQEKVLGLEIPVQSYMPRSRRILFVTYAVASYIYRWFVTFAILWFLSQVLKPYKLESVSYLLAAGARCSIGGNAGLPDRQVPSHSREVAQSEKGTCGRVRRGGDRARLRDPADPDAVTNRRNAGAQAGQARKRSTPRSRGGSSSSTSETATGSRKTRCSPSCPTRRKKKNWLERQQDHDIAWYKARWYRQSPEHRESRSGQAAG